MQIEIEIKFTTTLGDSFDDDEKKETTEVLIEQHITDFCEEHNIDRSDVRIIRSVVD